MLCCFCYVVGVYNWGCDLYKLYYMVIVFCGIIKCAVVNYIFM
ncbi:hypothetical protein NLO413_1008 [Candidatus Neoehrlichia lotoris str. RAC413]|uniref:Uncharacterized protein n=1 Tax=Candidatus Neoehrlichia procyonis str. RAC413 TaxID=1359163 RepID=A0A0F3NRV8_9RICK|nr:hypothetical protein NLO413_1008 [Candidatus Neoehrlichia lotoris str. RAC413]